MSVFSQQSYRKSSFHDIPCTVSADTADAGAADATAGEIPPPRRGQRSGRQRRVDSFAWDMASGAELTFCSTSTRPQTK